MVQMFLAVCSPEKYRGSNARFTSSLIFLGSRAAEQQSTEYRALNIIWLSCAVLKRLRPCVCSLVQCHERGRHVVGYTSRDRLVKLLRRNDCQAIPLLRQKASFVEGIIVPPYRIRRRSEGKGVTEGTRYASVSDNTGRGWKYIRGSMFPRPVVLSFL